MGCAWGCAEISSNQDKILYIYIYICILDAFAATVHISLTRLEEKNDRNHPANFSPKNDGHTSFRSYKNISMLSGSREAVPPVLFVVMSVHHEAE